MTRTDLDLIRRAERCLPDYPATAKAILSALVEAVEREHAAEDAHHDQAENATHPIFQQAAE